MEELVKSEIGRLGLAGLVIIGLIWDRSRLLKDIKDLRAQCDANLSTFHKTILEMTERLYSALTAGARANEAQAEATHELKETLESLTDGRIQKPRR